MSLYILGVGGTGARCIRALTYLCASGFLKGETLNTYFVDADETNGNLTEATETINKYIEIKNISARTGSSFGSSELFGAEIKNHKVWSPFSHYESAMKLEDLFSYETMQQSERELFEILYTKKKRQSTFENGFLGWPSVGSGIVAKEFDSLDNLTQAIAGDTNARVFLVGSIFGGTGSSGIPTLLKLLRQTITNENKEGVNRKLGILLMLPYFNFKDEESDDPNSNSMNFKLKTKIALEYYYNQGFHNLCDSIYTLSDSFSLRTAEERAKGGETQKNRPHFLELYAGLMSIDFFTKSSESPNNKYFEASRNFQGEINWNDLIFNENTYDSTLNRLGKFASFSYAYSTKFYNLVKKCQSVSHQQAVGSYQWYGQIFPTEHPRREHIVLFDAVRDFSSGFLSWLKMIQQSSKGSVDIKLIKETYLPPNSENFVFGDFIHGKDWKVQSGFFVKKYSTGNINDFEKMFTDRRKNLTSATGLGKFISELYEASFDF